MIINSKNGMIVAGRATRDAELKIVGSRNSHLTKFSIVGINGTDEKPTVFVDVVAWFDLADYANSICKGDRVFIAGTIKNSDYTNQNGELIKRNDLVADFIQIQSRKELLEENTINRILPPNEVSNFEEIDDDEIELPF